MKGLKTLVNKDPASGLSSYLRPMLVRFPLPNTSPGALKCCGTKGEGIRRQVIRRHQCINIPTLTLLGCTCSEDKTSQHLMQAFEFCGCSCNVVNALTVPAAPDSGGGDAKVAELRRWRFVGFWHQVIPGIWDSYNTVSCVEFFFQSNRSNHRSKFEP